MSQYAAALDVDGVLLRGGEAVPGAAEALERLHGTTAGNVLYLTNSGGLPEAEKAAKIAAGLGGRVPIDEAQVVLSHTPLSALAREPGMAQGLVSAAAAFLWRRRGLTG